MPLTNSQYNALMRVYEEKRAKSRDLANLHYERACQKVPELASIDASISSASLDQAKKLLAGDDTALASLKEDIRSLSDRRRRLLSDAGFPEDYLEQHFECPDCQDTGYVGTKKCHCFLKAIIDLFYTQSNLKGLLEQENFEHFNFDYYSSNYNYWLQLGIAEQLDTDYEKALNHFTQAEAIGPNSYMVKNAIGKNYILQAINEDAIALSRELFDRGKELLMLLINTKEEFQVKAYSIHTYVTGLIRYYSSKKSLIISSKEINEAQSLLDRMLEKDKLDPLFNKVNKQFNRFLINSSTGKLKLDLHKLQMINEAEDINDDLW